MTSPLSTRRGALRLGTCALFFGMAGCADSSAQPVGSQAVATVQPLAPGLGGAAPQPGAASPAPASMPVPTPDAPAAAAPLPEPEALSPAATNAEAARLRALFAQALGARAERLGPHDAAMLALAQREARAHDMPLVRPQLAVVVDRSPAVQSLWLVLARPNGPWEALGRAHVSTGQPGRFDHYITPTGVFLHTDAILDFRAEGTFNENHIRGYGLKGTRIWDFGWQQAQKGWRADTGPIRLQMHATDPDRLEQRLGRPASQGCIRIPAVANHFFDRMGVLDVDYERVAVEDVRYRALLPRDRTPTPLAGRALIVIDSSAAAPGRAPGERVASAAAHPGTN